MRANGGPFRPRKRAAPARTNQLSLHRLIIINFHFEGSLSVKWRRWRGARRWSVVSASSFSQGLLTASKARWPAECWAQDAGGRSVCTRRDWRDRRSSRGPARGPCNWARDKDTAPRVTVRVRVKLPPVQVCNPEQVGADGGWRGSRPAKGAQHHRVVTVRVAAV